MTEPVTADLLLARCEGCGNEIDPNCCHCGDAREGHSDYGGHPFVPMGCDCLRAVPEGVCCLRALETGGQRHNPYCGRLPV